MSTTVTGAKFFVARMAGYENSEFECEGVGKIEHHFVLERDLALQVQDELSSYEPDYVEGVVTFVGLAEKALHSPRMMVGSATSEALTQYDQLRVRFPARVDCALDRTVKRVVTYLRAIRDSSSNRFVGIFVKPTEEAIAKVRRGLGI